MNWVWCNCWRPALSFRICSRSSWGRTQVLARGHHWAFQIDPGLGVVSWRSGRRALTISPSFIRWLFFLICLCHPEATAERKKTLFFGWVWIISPHYIPQKQIRTYSFNNKYASVKKSYLVYVFWHKTICSSWKVLSFSQKCCNLKCFSSWYRGLSFLAGSAETCIFFCDFSLLSIKMRTTWMKWMSNNIANIKEKDYERGSGVLSELEVDTEGGHVLHVFMKPEASCSPRQETLLLAYWRVFPWKPKQVRALTGRGVEAQLAKTGGGDTRMRSTHWKACHIKQPKSPHGTSTKNSSELNFFWRLAC